MTDYNEPQENKLLHIIHEHHPNDTIFKAAVDLFSIIKEQKQQIEEWKAATGYNSPAKFIDALDYKDCK